MPPTFRKALATMKGQRWPEGWSEGRQCHGGGHASPHTGAGTGQAPSSHALRDHTSIGSSVVTSVPWAGWGHRVSWNRGHVGSPDALLSFIFI